MDARAERGWVRSTGADWRVSVRGSILIVVMSIETAEEIVTSCSL